MTAETSTEKTMQDRLTEAVEIMRMLRQLGAVQALSPSQQANLRCHMDAFVRQGTAHTMTLRPVPDAQLRVMLSNTQRSGITQVLPEPRGSR